MDNEYIKKEKWKARAKEADTKMELQKANSSRPSRVDAHGAVVLEGDADAAAICKYLGRKLIQGGAMSRQLYNKDTTRIKLENSALKGPQEL